MENQKKQSPYNLHYYADGIEVTKSIFDAIAICNILRPELSVPCVIATEKRPEFTGSPVIAQMIRQSFENYDEMFPDKRPVYSTAVRD